MTPREALQAVGGEGKLSVLAAVGWCLTGLNSAQSSAGRGAWQVDSRHHGAVPADLPGQARQAEKVLAAIWGAAGLSGQSLDIDVPAHLALLCCAWRTPSAVETLLSKGASIDDAIDRLPEGARWKARAALWVGGIGTQKSAPVATVESDVSTKAKQAGGGLGLTALLI
mgnify:CR=1 FL=1